jgi:hypothetical protein
MVFNKNFSIGCPELMATRVHFMMIFDNCEENVWDEEGHLR